MLLQKERGRSLTRERRRWSRKNPGHAPPCTRSPPPGTASLGPDPQPAAIPVAIPVAVGANCSREFWNIVQSFTSGTPGPQRTGGAGLCAARASAYR